MYCRHDYSPPDFIVASLFPFINILSRHRKSIINNQFTITRDNEGVYAAEKTYISRPDFVSLSEKG
jgi:hypothetical protein